MTLAGGISLCAMLPSNQNSDRESRTLLQTHHSYVNAASCCLTVTDGNDYNATMLHWLEHAACSLVPQQRKDTECYADVSQHLPGIEEKFLSLVELLYLSLLIALTWYSRCRVGSLV